MSDPEDTEHAPGEHSGLSRRTMLRLGMLAISATQLPAIPAGAQAPKPGAHLIGKLALAAAEYARREGFAQDGYRIVMNCREDAGQTVFHIHMHLLAGAPLGHFGTPGR